MDYIQRATQEREQDMQTITNIIKEVDRAELKRILMYTLESYQDYIEKQQREAAAVYEKLM